MSDATTSRMTEYQDRREWDLSGFALTQVTFDPAQITILIYDMENPYLLGRDKPARSSANINIRNVFTLCKGNTQAVLNPELHITCVLLVSLILEPVNRLRVYRDCTFELSFNNGYGIKIDNKYSPYESWDSCGMGMLSEMNMLAVGNFCPWGN